MARDRHEAAYPFGFGLSYTTWELGPTTVDDDGEELVVRAVHRNVGARDGSDVLQVYAGPTRPTPPGPPGGSSRSPGSRCPPASETTVECRVPWSRLAVREPDRTWAVAPGTYVLTIGRHAADVAAVDLLVDRL